ncbi:hypothetical protein TWF694_005323 [Orbilia ellipsospora]|uniref:Transmembrane protein n=1 Tax=Orbilia ellipsospora TaxID=2528407 RepID=A0AAV9WV94_9PEZI
MSELNLTGPAASRSSSVFSVVLPLFGVSALSYCFGRRIHSMPKWSEVPLVRWLILAIYFDSWLFVFSSTTLNAGFSLRSSIDACNAGILLCLICYLTTKIIYFFLVEKVYIIRSKHKGPRRKDKLYLFNTLGMLFPYFVVIILTFIFRVSEIKDGECYIGLRLAANIPLLVFDAAINVYLTSLFLIPLLGNSNFDQGSPKVRAMAKRTFWGSAATLVSTIANLTTLVILRGHEPGWICFACCNADVVFSAVVLHWVTSTDYERPEPQSNRKCGHDSSICLDCIEIESDFNPELRKHRMSLKAVSPRRQRFTGPGMNGGEVVTEIASKPSSKGTNDQRVDGITVRVEHDRHVEEECCSRDSREVMEESYYISDSGSVDAISPK